MRFFFKLRMNIYFVNFLTFKEMSILETFDIITLLNNINVQCVHFYSFYQNFTKVCFRSGLQI